MCCCSSSSWSVWAWLYTLFWASLCLFFIFISQKKAVRSRPGRQPTHHYKYSNTDSDDYHLMIPQQLSLFLMEYMEVGNGSRERWRTIRNNGCWLASLHHLLFFFYFFIFHALSIPYVVFVMPRLLHLFFETLFLWLSTHRSSLDPDKMRDDHRRCWGNRVQLGVSGGWEQDSSSPVQFYRMAARVDLCIL